MVIYKEEYPEGDKAIVEVFGNWVGITQSKHDKADYLTLTRDEAIAAARAILAHYKEPV